MMPLDSCPDCGAELADGLCPRCLVKLGIDRPGEVPDFRSETSDTHAFNPDSPTPTVIATGEHGPDGATKMLGRPDPDATTAAVSESPAPRASRVTRGEGIGTVIAGRYTLVEVIGEGGMGSVYLARQTEPVKRQVALKLIKTGMDSRGVLARFDAERQALALMDHPNIARIYDGGVTPAGQPFFVMELVHGVPLTDYCDQKRLTVKDRLELFVSVCQAVQHAPPEGDHPPRPEAGERAGDRGGRPPDAQGHRLRRGEGDRAEPDGHELCRHRGDRGHSHIHVARASRPVVDGHRHADRRVCPRGHALRTADRFAAAGRRRVPDAGRCWRCCGWCARSIRLVRAPG